MTNPLVSIIVPVYNAQKGLSRCLESICSQTYQELEIIVLNDGSTDDSLAICEQFRAKDPRIVVVDKENEGVSRTRNAGLTLAQGDYIQFADSDDALDLITPEPCAGRLAAQRRPCDRPVLDGDPFQLQQDRARAGNAADLPWHRAGSPQDRGAQVRLSAAGRLQPGGLRPPPDAAARLLLLRRAVEQTLPPGDHCTEPAGFAPMCTGPRI